MFCACVRLFLQFAASRVVPNQRRFASATPINGTLTAIAASSAVPLGHCTNPTQTHEHDLISFRFGFSSRVFSPKRIGPRTEYGVSRHNAPIAPLLFILQRNQFHCCQLLKKQSDWSIFNADPSMVDGCPRCSHCSLHAAEVTQGGRPVFL